MMAATSYLACLGPQPRNSNPCFPGAQHPLLPGSTHRVVVGPPLQVQLCLPPSAQSFRGSLQKSGVGTRLALPQATPRQAEAPQALGCPTSNSKGSTCGPRPRANEQAVGPQGPSTAWATPPAQSQRGTQRHPTGGDGAAVGPGQSQLLLGSQHTLQLTHSFWRSPGVLGHVVPLSRTRMASWESWSCSPYHRMPRPVLAFSTAWYCVCSKRPAHSESVPCSQCVYSS